MLVSAIVYLGFAIGVAGLSFCVKPAHRLFIPTRLHALALVGLGVAITGVGLALPAGESRVGHAQTRLDEFAPVWQFREFHTITIAAPPARAFEAIKRVRADEIAFFNMLNWIRRGGGPLPEKIRLAAERGDSLIDVAIGSNFVLLAEDPPRELLIGTVVGRPAGGRVELTPQTFRTELPPGYALATMNFLVTPDGGNGSLVSTETRVFANSPSARRKFAAYWRVIYPGSALIRRMWLGAIQRRATAEAD